MKNLFTLILLCSFPFYFANAQAPQTTLLKGKRMDSLRNIYRFQSEQRKNIENTLLLEGRKTHDAELLAFVEVLQFSALVNNPTVVEKFRNEIASKYQALPNVQARAYQILGYHYFIGSTNYEKAFDAYLQLEKLLEIHGPAVIADYANYCAEIASAYYKFKNFKKAIELGKKGLNYAGDKWDFYNTIGLCYQEIAQPDAAIFYLKRAVDEAVAKKKPDIYRTISLGNIGNCYYHQNRFELAKPLLKTDLEGALRIDDKGLAAGAAIPLADIYLKEQNWNAAAGLLNMARSYISQSKQLERLEKFYPVKSKYDELRGNTGLALANRDSAISAIKRNDSVFNSLLVMRVQQRSDMVKLAEEKSKLENYRKVSQTRLWALSIIFILIVTGFLIVRNYSARLEKDKKHIEELNRTLALRQRLSADMHDDIGSTLSSISLYAHSLLMQPQNDAQKSTLEKIKQQARHVQESVSDIIWSVNPKMDTMQEVVARMRSFGADLTEHAGIIFNFSVQEEIGQLQVEMSARRNLLLIYKEVVNNAVKYSASKHIIVNLKTKSNLLTLEIVDDGLGFDTSKKHPGNGLQNIQRRAQELKGELTVMSNAEGTRIRLVLPLA